MGDVLKLPWQDGDGFSRTCEDPNEAGRVLFLRGANASLNADALSSWQVTASGLARQPGREKHAP
jgi:hypothetical protein